jgi:DNA-binding GntR family transcriptional regulator
MEVQDLGETGRSLTLRAFEQLRADIISARLRPAERLRIQALSERYRIGATAIREALSRLVTDGLVEFEDQRGFCVAPVSRAVLSDLAQTRLDIERMALRYAVERGDIDWESQLMSAFHRLSRTPPPDSPENATIWSEVHRQFHMALVGGCGSAWLMRLCGLLYDQSERYRNFAIAQSESHARDTVGEHRELLDAALGRDVQTLDRLIGDHFGRTTEIIRRANFNDTVTAVRPAGRQASNTHTG